MDQPKPGDLIALGNRIRGTMQVNAKQVALQSIVLHNGSGGALFDEYARIHCLEIGAGAPDDEAPDDRLRRQNCDHASVVRSRNGGTLLAHERYLSREANGSAMRARKEDNGVSFGRLIHNGLQIFEAR